MERISEDSRVTLFILQIRKLDCGKPHPSTAQKSSRLKVATSVSATLLSHGAQSCKAQNKVMDYFAKCKFPGGKIMSFMHSQRSRLLFPEVLLVPLATLQALHRGKPNNRCSPLALSLLVPRRMLSSPPRACTATSPLWVMSHDVYRRDKQIFQMNVAHQTDFCAAQARGL